MPPACRQPHRRRRVPAAATGLVALAVLLAGGCQPETAIQPGDVRSYAAPKERKPPPRQATEEPSGGLSIRYDLPEGWTDRGGSGMRLATLLIGDPELRREVTVIPAAGTLRSNVERWQGQLGGPAEGVGAAVDGVLAAATTLDVDGVEATVVHLPPAVEGGEAILGAMIPLDDSAALFVKFKGAADVATDQRAAFEKFVASIRWK